MDNKLPKGYIVLVQRNRGVSPKKSYYFSSLNKAQQFVDALGAVDTETCSVTSPSGYTLATIYPLYKVYLEVGQDVPSGTEVVRDNDTLARRWV